MLYNYSIEKLLGLQGVKITNIENEEKNTTVTHKLQKLCILTWRCGRTPGISIDDTNTENGFFSRFS